MEAPAAESLALHAVQRLCGGLRMRTRLVEDAQSVAPTSQPSPRVRSIYDGVVFNGRPWIDTERWQEMTEQMMGGH